MADAGLTKRIAELEAEIERLKAARPPRTRLSGQLTESRLQKLGKTGSLVGDGNNLLYKSAGLGRGCWIYRYKAGGKARDIGLGGYAAVSLADARIARDELNRLRNQGHDPHAERHRKKETVASSR